MEALEGFETSLLLPLQKGFQVLTKSLSPFFGA